MARATRAELHAFSRDRPIEQGTVLYESFAGNGVLCNPEAIFRELVRSPDLQDLKHIWVLDDKKRHQGIQQEFRAHPHVRFVSYRSFAYFRALATSQYLINNSTFPREFSKRAGQIYLNTWHGTPLKLMGYDMPDGAAESANVLRNFLSADFLLSGGPFMTRRIYAEAYKLEGTYRGQVIEEGYPRTDRQWMDAAETAAGRKRLEDSGIDLRGRSIVLYAPTWKGTSFSRPVDDARALLDSAADLQDRLGTEHFVVLLKTHQVVHRFAEESHGSSPIVVPNDIPTNLILGLTSVLVTDYSSIIVDFFPLERPAFFYTPDAHEYTDERGTYFDSNELPGTVCTSMAELADAISGTAHAPAPPTHSAQALGYIADLVPHDDGKVSTRVVDIVFRDRVEGRRLIRLSEEPRPSILLHLGGMRSNGITTSALSLLDRIDHDAFDVSVVLQKPTGPEQQANQVRIDPRVRQFHRAGGMNGHKSIHVHRRLRDILSRRARSSEPERLRRMWSEEWYRCFGDSSFDAVIDFSGYSPFWANLLSHSPAASRSIWLHNDMMAETQRYVRGRKRMRRSLPAVFSMFTRFDSLVSVSPSLAEVNARTLAGPWDIGPEHFVSARNVVDAAHVTEGLAAPLTSLVDPEDSFPQDVAQTLWREEIEHRDDLRWFVSVGRFSPEKNQARLLRSFASVYAKNPNTRLVIVGYGPMKLSLERTIGALGLSEAAFLVGPYSNPFPVLARADCFVLSSNYEGQPMVLLEAAIVGLPIVSVDFATVRDALPDSRIHVVDQDDAALAAGMEAFLRGEVPSSHLDVPSYNTAAIGEFHAATHTSVQRSASGSRA